MWERTEAAAFTLIELSHTTTDQGIQTDQAIQTTHRTQTDKVTPVDAGQQADIVIGGPKKHQPLFRVSIIEGNDKTTKFYTGASNMGNVPSIIYVHFCINGYNVMMFRTYYHDWVTGLE